MWTVKLFTDDEGCTESNDCIFTTPKQGNISKQIPFSVTGHLTSFIHCLPLQSKLTYTLSAVTVQAHLHTVCRYSPSSHIHCLPLQSKLSYTLSAVTAQAHLYTVCRYSSSSLIHCLPLESKVTYTLSAVTVQALVPSMLEFESVAAV